ncbi:hypothetical protein BGX23_009430 [Mortierella sp. AD031]|nr:hypothetical protein BGX23_009430 [Mortierella sp. AD031]KAG0211162.1 hypothetical protein BGX33_004487 [Mortierella sp. NVP41]
MPNYVSLTESQRRKIAVFITESQPPALQQSLTSNGDDSLISSSSLTGSPSASTTNLVSSNTNNISCKEIVQFCKTRFGLTISLSTASRLRSSATERLSTELLNPSAKRHRSVKFPEFEKALILELRALEQEQQQIQQEQERQMTAAGGAIVPLDPSQLPPVMTLTSEASITQVAKGIAERMGIPETELGLTSGWYHGFKRRHGIKHRQFRPKGGNAASTGSDGPTLGSIGLSSGAGTNNTSGSMMDTGDGSDGVEGDEEMEDAGQDSSNGAGGDDDRLSSAMRPLRTTDDNNTVANSFDNGPGTSIDPGPNSPGDATQAGVNTGSSSSSSQPLSFLKGEQFNFTPRDPQLSSLSRRPEVKKVDASKANDALDIISEYLLQNGQIGAAKLPLVKELRKFFLAQMALENGPINDSILLTSLANPVPLPVPAPVAVTVPEPRVEPTPSPVSMVTSDANVFVNSTVESALPQSTGGAGLAQILGSDRSPLSSALATMESVIISHSRQAQQEQERSPNPNPTHMQ